MATKKNEVAKKDDVQKEKKYLSIDEILAADDRPVVDVHVPEWGGYVRVAPMTGRDRAKLEMGISKLGSDGQVVGYNLDRFRELVVAYSIVDENGERLFDDKQISVLAERSSVALDRVADVAQSVNKLSEDDLDDLAKN